MKQVADLLWMRVRLLRHGVGLATLHSFGLMALLLVAARLASSLRAWGPALVGFLFLHELQAGLARAGAPFQSSRGHGPAAYRALPATWRQAATSALVFWTVGVFGLVSTLAAIALSTLPAGFLLELKGEGPWRNAVFDTLALWALGVPALVLAVRAGMLGPRLRTGAAVLELVAVCVALLALGRALGPHAGGHIVLGCAVTGLIFVTPDAWLSRAERLWLPRPRTSGILPATPVPLARESAAMARWPVAMVWWTLTKYYVAALFLTSAMTMGAMALASRSFNGRLDVDTTMVIVTALTMVLFVNYLDGAAPKMALRTVLARLPLRPVTVGTRALLVGVVYGALLASVAFAACVLRTTVNPRLEPLGGADAVRYAAVLSFLIFVLVMVAQLARAAPVGACPHYAKITPASLLPLGASTFWLCPPALLFAIAGVQPVMGTMMLARMGNPRLANPRGA